MLSLYATLLLMDRSCMILSMKFLLDLMDIEMRDFSIFTIEDLGQLLESWASSLDVEEVNEGQFDEDPDLVSY